LQDIDTFSDSPRERVHEGYRLFIESDPRRIRAEFQGETIADSAKVLVMHETRLGPVFYFPREDVRMDLLIKSDRHTHCPFKGNASHWTIRVGEKSAKNAAWSYETPYDESSSVKGYIAFYWQEIDKWYGDETQISEQPRGKVDTKENPIVNWLVYDAWKSKSSRDLVMRFSDAMIAAGFPLWRLRLLVRTLNPLLYALIYTWQRDCDEVTVFEISHENLQSEQYRNSPFALVINGEGGVRRRLEGPRTQLDFPVLKDLVAEGATDYVAIPLRFSDEQLNILTLVSDRTGGFSTDELGQIYEILQTLSRLFESHALRVSSSTLLRTYLGSHAGQRVMDGLVKRGDGEKIHAVIWFCDLRGSTPLAESMPTEDFLILLNQFFDCMAGAILDNGGEVLRFIGDAVLAIFPIGETGRSGCALNSCEADACATAIKASLDARQRVKELNANFAENGQQFIEFGIGVHLGHVMYGNIGVPERLEFTVIGAAANEAARIESMCKILNQSILLSAEVAKQYAGELKSLGSHALRGVSTEQEIFTLP
jgi:class 3 adenylate cyclase/uncharacterized protein (DUF427 family)